MQAKAAKEVTEHENSELKKSLVVFVLGGPGSGKGTQCERLVRDFGFKHLSAGDLLRAEVAAGTTVGRKCDRLMKDGKLVPTEITIAMMRNAMIASPNKRFLIDGFPRAVDQAVAFEKAICDPAFSLFFECPEEVMESRLLKRGETSGRSDDNAATIRKRFDTFTSQSLPVIHHYTERSNVFNFSSVPPPDEVYVKVQALVEERLAALTKDVPPVVVFVLGGPGSGKGTQCERIVRDFGFKHLSAGDLLRDEVASGSTLGQTCETLMKEGKLVPMEVTIGLLQSAMASSKNKKFLIDGFPRALDQAEAFEKQVVPCNFVLFIDCSLETMQKRLLKRGETSGRSDDNIATIKKRFDTFTNQSLPVVDHFGKEGKMFRVSSNPAPDVVYGNVKAIFKNQLNLEAPEGPMVIFVLGGPGSGKGTQCERIVRDFGFKHLSAGDLLRNEVASGSALGVECETLMKEGKLVPMEVTISLLKSAMEKSENKQFLIDGFPRALDQAMAFEKEVAPCNFVLFFDCPLETMQDRLLKRGETSGRSDDNIATIKKRFDTFQNQSMAVIEYFDKLGKVFHLSAVPPPDTVYAEVKVILGGSNDAAEGSKEVVEAWSDDQEAAALKIQLATRKKMARQQTMKMREEAAAAAHALREKALVVFVLGGPGSGKGTQCERIVRDFGFKHLSAGDLLRNEVASGSTVGKKCEALMKEGKLVPMEITIALLKNAMEASDNKRFLIDGFPRALDQAKAFESAITEPTFTLFFDCPLETMQERLLKRGETSGRSDDNIETIKKRFDTFTNQSLPVIDYYETKKSVFKLSSVPPPDEVYGNVEQVFRSKLDEKSDGHKEEGAIVFVLGGPGSGKGTQCERLVAKYGFQHFSAGDLLRDEVKSGSELGQKCEALMKEGKLVPMEATIALLKGAMDKSANKKFLIDGFPRALDQGLAFEKEIGPCSYVLFFDCPEETMESRLLKRGETSGRSDDNIETIKKRFHTFVTQSLPVVTHYEKQGKAFKVSSVPPPDEVFAIVQDVVEVKGPAASAARGRHAS